MRILFSILLFFLSVKVYAETAISPYLYFLRSADPSALEKAGADPLTARVPVTVRFTKPPSPSRIVELEQSGLRFSRLDGIMLHSRSIYPARIDLGYLDDLRRAEDIARIELSVNPTSTATLDVSNPQVEASRVWNSLPTLGTHDGSGVIIANVDTGIDIYHPGLFKADGGTFDWIDVNANGSFEAYTDAVDLDGDGFADTDESLAFYEPSMSDPLGLITHTTGIYDADLDWLVNDADRNGSRDYGPSAGFSETAPSFGERVFIIEDTNDNNRLDPGEKLVSLGTSKILSAFDKNGEYHRGTNLFEALLDEQNHGTGSTGILCGQQPGRRFTGMAPGAEIISVNRIEADVTEGVLFAQKEGAKCVMYEFATWVYEFLDGSSNFETFINEMSDEGIHQFAASGNLAGPTRKKHARLTISPSSSGTLSMAIPQEYGITSVYLSFLWNENHVNPAISVSDGVRSVQINGNDRQYNLSSCSVVSGLDVSSKGTTRMDVLLSSNNPFSGDMTFSISNLRLRDFTIDAYVTDNKTNWMHGTQFTDHVTDDGTVCSPGTAEKIITVGAYDPRGTRNIKGDINDFSSWGMTIDGRRAVDITAPGTLVYSLTAHTVTGGAPGGYIDFGGTSSALPHVVGCAALIVQYEPEITFEALSSFLYEGSLSDSFTGIVPNPVWGYGKLRIYSSFTDAGIVTAVKDQPTPGSFFVSGFSPNPFNAFTTCTLKLPSPSEISITVYNLLGQRVFFATRNYSFPGEHTFTWDGTGGDSLTLSSGIYFISFSSPHYTHTGKVLLMK